MQETPSSASSMTRLAVGVVVASLGAVLLAAGLMGALTPSGRVPASEGPGGTTAIVVASPTASTTGSPAAESPAATPASPLAPSPSSGADPILVGAGDIASCGLPDDSATAALLEQLPGQVFTLGDNAYESGTAAQFRDCYGPTWGRVLDRTTFPVPGNHDYGTPAAAGYRAYFGAAATPDGTTWYSRDVGTWHVIVLDADCGQVGGCGPDSPQGRWLASDLAASQARCTLALWHQPRFSSGAHGNDPAVAPFWDALYAAGADLVLNGHDHDYERFGPQDPRGRSDPARGITEIVVGTGGAALRNFGTEAANAIVRSNIAHGVLELTLRPGGWSFRFVSTDGSFSDIGRGTCH